MAGLHDVAKAVGLRDEQADGLFKGILETVKRGEKVIVRNFGTFEGKEAAARTVTSPQIPGGKAEVPARTVLRFHASTSVRDELNAGKGKAKGTPAPKAKPAAGAAKKTAAPAGAKATGAPPKGGAAATKVATPAAPAKGSKPAPAPAKASKLAAKKATAAATPPPAPEPVTDEAPPEAVEPAAEETAPTE